MVDFETDNSIELDKYLNKMRIGDIRFIKFNNQLYVAERIKEK